MTPPISIGDEVTITGPTITGCNCFMGETFKISRECEGAYSGGGFPWYPASSLRLVEELKIGDWVDAIGPHDGNHVLPSDYEKTFQIAREGDGDHGHWYKSATFGEPGWPASSLRKLTTEEIKPHVGKNIGEFTATLKLDTSEFDEAMRKVEAYESPSVKELRRRIHDLEMSLDGFTNGPEPEHVSGVLHVKDPIRKRLSAIEKRLYILEGEMPEICERQHDCKPNDRSICISIQRTDTEAQGIMSKCPAECLEWCEKVLDSMREA